LALFLADFVAHHLQRNSSIWV